MTLMVVAHPIPGFNGRVFADEVAMAFVGGFAVANVPTGVQADLTARGFTLNATPGTNYGGKYVLEEDLADPGSQASASLRAAFVPSGVVVLGEDRNGHVAQVEVPGTIPAFTNPTSLPGCALWLDGSQVTGVNGSSVASWTDRSGRGHDAMQATSGSRPTLSTAAVNGRNAVYFLGSGEFLEINNFGFTPGTVFVVGSNDGDNSHRAFLGGISADTNNPIDAWYFKANGSPTAAAEFSFGDNRSAGNLTQYAGLPRILHQVYCQAGTFEAGTKTISLWNNGGRPQRSTAQGTPGVTQVTPGSKVAVGADYYAHAASDHLSGLICEVIFYDRVLSHAEMTAVGRYLASKWGITVKDFALPAPVTEPLLLATFEYTSGASAWQTHIAASVDGVNWRNINDNVPVVCAPPIASDGGAANGSLYRHSDGFWYLATTAYNDTPTFNIHRSADLFTWEYWKQVDCSGVTGSSRAWAPEWFVDTDGSLHILLCLSVGGSHQLYETHPSDTPATMRAWSTPAIITGTSLPAQMIDPYMVKMAGSYYLFYKNDTTGFTEVVSSTSLLSGYVVARSGSWISATTPQEGPAVFRVNGHWRILVDPGSLQYADSNDLVTWTSLAPLTFTPPPAQSMRHGTVVRR